MLPYRIGNTSCFSSQVIVNRCSIAVRSSTQHCLESKCFPSQPSIVNQMPKGTEFSDLFSAILYVYKFCLSTLEKLPFFYLQFPLMIRLSSNIGSGCKFLLEVRYRKNLKAKLGEKGNKTWPILGLKPASLGLLELKSGLCQIALSFPVS